ncbi:PREDICTED: venom serine carboxypeptidase-like, partial [Rhagoletis zephyria]|uniref:venom serine carboxypeptidase-like n=1 Tax=Rhagoletis zephyria TaxID=28612 RepID=UPI0008118038
MKQLTALTVLLRLLVCSSFASCLASSANQQQQHNDDLPLLLTPYIENGKISEGRNLSEVTAIPGLDLSQHLKSYSGYLTINTTTNANTFFWFFPAKNGQTKDVPLILWLNGGPGASGFSAVFLENGPLELVLSADKKSVVPRLHEHSWNEQFAVLYIDNPVGTGFSFTDQEGGYATDETRVGIDIYNALRQFLVLFSEYRGTPLFVAGVSYGGKYVPAVGHHIHLLSAEQTKEDGVNLQGLSIGNGLCDPRNQLNYGDFLWKLGLLDRRQRDHFQTVQSEARSLIDQRQTVKALELVNELFLGISTDGKPPKPSYFTNVTGLRWVYNLNVEEMPVEYLFPYAYVRENSTRRALHAGTGTAFTEGSPAVIGHLLADIYSSVRPWIEELLAAGRYRMLFYNGNLDIIVAATLTEDFLNGLQWGSSGNRSFYAAERKVWKVAPSDRSVAGYVKTLDNLTFAVVRNSGHVVSRDQPRVAADLITRFIK